MCSRVICASLICAGLYSCGGASETTSYPTLSCNSHLAHRRCKTLRRNYRRFSAFSCRSFAHGRLPNPVASQGAEDSRRSRDLCQISEMLAFFEDLESEGFPSTQTSRECDAFTVIVPKSLLPVPSRVPFPKRDQVDNHCRLQTPIERHCRESNRFDQKRCFALSASCAVHCCWNFPAQYAAQCFLLSAYRSSCQP